jgi:hypothetical protein
VIFENKQKWHRKDQYRATGVWGEKGAKNKKNGT